MLICCVLFVIVDTIISRTTEITTVAFHLVPTTNTKKHRQFLQRQQRHEGTQGTTTTIPTSTQPLSFQQQQQQERFFVLRSTTSSTTTRKNDVYVNCCPKISPATGLTNHFYTWKNQQQIRYQTTSLSNGDRSSSSSSSSSSSTSSSSSSSSNDVDTHPILFIHGLFTNSDHWRHSLKYFAKEYDTKQKRYTAYAIDLYGCGYSDKPFTDSDIAQACNGETHRFVNNKNVNNGILDEIIQNVSLGTSDGTMRTEFTHVELRHPLGSPYNFYTWADLIADFCNDIILSSSTSTTTTRTTTPKVTLVCNSIGTISALQAVLDHSTLFNGVFVISPNFRELHSAEVPFPSITMPILRFQQSLLRNVIGQPLFDILAKPDIVRNILKVPYAIEDAVDDELVQVLLDPLLTPGASNVVFDTLSYSAGPLPEPQLQQLSQMFGNQNTTTSNNNNNNNSRSQLPIWVCYGSDDPWTPGRRVEALATNYKNVVEKVICLPGVGHCPHDEAPELVHPILMDFLQHIYQHR